MIFRSVFPAICLIALVLLSPCRSAAQEDTTHWSVSLGCFVDQKGNTPDSDAAFLIEELTVRGDRGEQYARKELLDLFARPEARMIYADVVRRYATPLSDSITKSQHENYAKVFLQERSQKAGLKFLRDHAKSLRGAQARYGVRQKDIVALLMWESGLGKYTGKYRIFNVFLGEMFFLDSARAEIEADLAKAGAKDPLKDPETNRREAHRRAERKRDATLSLIALLRMSKHHDIDPLSIKGSWGGAVGFVQFLPYNLRYAVDADGNGLDLTTWPDAIYSVARYLKERGKYRNTLQRRRRALMTYNASPEYAEGIIHLADTLWKRHLAGE